MKAVPHPCLSILIKKRKTVLTFLACVVLLAYLITPPAGVEYDLGGYLTIRNFRSGANTNVLDQEHLIFMYTDP